MNERITTNLKTNHTNIKFSVKLNIVFENWAAQVSVSQVSIGQNSKIILLLAHQFVLFHNNTGINMWMMTGAPVCPPPSQYHFKS